MTGRIAVILLALFGTAHAAPAYFRPADQWDAVPRTEKLYVCGAHKGYGHALLDLWSNVVVDFACPGEPGSIDGEMREAGFYVRNLANVEIRNARIFNTGRGVLITDSTNVRIVGGEFSRNGTGTACLEVTGATQNVEIRSTEIHDCTNGIWVGTASDKPTPHVGVKIVGNYIHDIYGSPDSHGIGIQTATDSEVRHNIVTRTDGPAIAWYWWNGTHPMYRNTVEANAIFDIRRSGRSVFATAPRGIDFGTSSGTGKTRCGNVVIGNTILRVEGGEAIYAKGSDISSPDCEPLSVEFNYADGHIRVRGASASSRRPHLDDNTVSGVK